MINILFATHNCHMWAVPEVAIVKLCWNMPWGNLVKGFDYTYVEWTCPNTITQMKGKPRRINQYLIESRKRKFRKKKHFAILPLEYP